jgi:glycosyltransferase involved in cell wall biosynthesis
MKKKILVVANTAFSIKKFRLHYLSKLSEKYDLEIYTPDLIILNNYKNIIFEKLGINNNIKEFFTIKKLLKKNIHLFIIYSFKYQFYFFLLNFFYQKKIINIIAGRGSIFFLKNNFMSLCRDILFKIFFRYTKNNVFINLEDKFFFKKKYLINNNIFTLPTEGIEIINRKQSKLNNKNFLFFSRLIKEKGIFEFIELAKRINKKFSKTRFFIAGSFDKKIVGQSKKITKEDLQKEIKNCNFIKFIGFKSKNIPSFLSTMDCLVSPSYAEGAGQSVMEAILSGLHVVVFKNSGHKYILNNEKKFICKNNSVEELYKLTSNFINENKNIARKVISKSQTHIIKKFSSVIVYKKLLDIIEKIIDEKKLVSICLASHNHEKYIDACLNSILQQSYSNIEVLISDDCSSDNSFKKIKKFFFENKGRLKIKIFRQNKNIGVSKNFNFLYKQASGDYIVFFGGDDVMSNERINKQVRALNLNRNSSFCYSNCKWIFEKYKFLTFSHFNFFHKPPKILINLLRDYNIPSCTMMINRKYIDQNPFDEKLKYFSDFLQTVKLWKKKKPVYIAENLTLYRRHNESIIGSNKFIEERLSQISAVKKLFNNNQYLQKQVNQNINVYYYHKILCGEVLSISYFKLIAFLFYNLKSTRGLLRLISLFFYSISLKKKINLFN